MKANQGAAGVDGQSIADFEADLKNNLFKVWNRMSSGTYFPPRCGRWRYRNSVAAAPGCRASQCISLHLEMQFKYNRAMSTTTVGFAVADEDRERLDRLVEYFGGGNRSAYLRATLTVMESLARAERLRDLQARNAERAAAAGQDYESLLAEVRRAYKDGVRQG